MGIRIGIKQPERDIHALDLVNMVLILKNLREQSFAAIMLHKRSFGRLFIQLKRNDIVRAQRTCELTHHHHGVAAEGAGRSGGGRIAHDLAAAGLAHIAAQILRFSLLPLTARRRFLLHIVGLLGFQGIVIALQSLHVKLGAAIRTFHLLRSAVKLDGTAAAWAFIFL